MSKNVYQITIDVYNPEDSDFTEQLELHNIKMVSSHWIGNTYDVHIQGKHTELKKFLKKAYVSPHTESIEFYMGDAKAIK